MGGFGGGGGGDTGGGSAPSFSPVTMIFFVDLPNFPEWAIPMTKIIPRIYIDDGYDMSQVAIDASFRHYWHVTPNQDAFGVLKAPSVSVKVIVSAQAQDNSQSPSVVIPTYVDIDLVFVNERVWKETNSNKS